MKNKNSNNFNLTIEGNHNSIDVKLLTRTLTNFNTLIQEINNEAKTGNELSFEIQTFQPGSFDILCSLIGDAGLTNSLFNVFNKDNLDFASKIIGMLADIISVSEFLNGNQPEKIENQTNNKISIKNNEGEIRIIDKSIENLAIKNSVVNLTINNVFSDFEKNENITGFSIKDNKGKNKVKINRESFKKLTKQIEIDENAIEERNNIIASNVCLNIFKIVFDHGKKWEFFYLGRKISANIIDTDFINKMMQRQIKFMNGDMIVADMAIERKFNNIANTFENKNYTVLKIHDIINNPIQSGIVF